MSNASSKPTGLPQAATSTKVWPWHPAVALVMTVAVFVVSQLTAGLLAVGGMALYKPDDITAQFATIFVAEALVILMVYWLLRRRGIGFRQLGFERPHWMDVWMPAIVFVLYYLGAAAALGVLQQLVPGIDGNQTQEIGFDNAGGFGQLALVFMALVICAPVAEEVLFRGFLFGSLRRRGSFVKAMVITSLLFGFAHLSGGSGGFSIPLWTAGLDTLCLSLALCYLREKTGRLWSSILLHATKNLLAFIIIFVIHT